MRWRNNASTRLGGSFFIIFQPAQLCISKVPTEPRLAHGPPKPLELRKSPRHLMEAACKVKNVANTPARCLYQNQTKKYWRNPNSFMNIEAIVYICK